MKHFLLVTLCSLCILFSCDPVEIPVLDPCPPYCPEEVDDYPLEIVWETYLYPDTTAMLFKGLPITYNDYILFGGWEPISEYIYVIIVDKESGEFIQRLKHFKNPINRLTIVDNYLITSCLDGVRVFDLESLTLVKYIEGLFSNKHNSLGSDVYVVQSFDKVPYRDSSSIMKLSFPSMELSKVFTITHDEYGSFTSLTPPGLDIVDGDTILYTNTYADSSYMFAYNISEERLDWRTSLYGPDQYFNAPLLDEHYIYMAHGHAAQAFDKRTGEQVWITPMEGFYRAKKPLLIDGLLYYKAGNDHMYCIDAADGKIVWHNSKSGNAIIVSPTYFDGKLFWVDEAFMHVIDATNGKRIFKNIGPYEKIDLDNLEESQKLFAKFAPSAPIVDEEKGVIYTPDWRRMFCFKIPDDW